MGHARAVDTNSTSSISAVRRALLGLPGSHHPCSGLGMHGVNVLAAWRDNPHAGGESFRKTWNPHRGWRAGLRRQPVGLWLLPQRRHTVIFTAQPYRNRNFQTSVKATL
jgi:hypothetical protein